MVTDRSEKTTNENRSDCESRTSSGKEIPKLTGVVNISCPKLNEVLCCQKLAHSVLFYIFVVLFLLVFVYILRKLVSLPVSAPKNSSRKPSHSTATAVHSNSSDALTGRLPQQWPKADNIVDSLTPATITPPKDKKNRIHDASNIGKQSYGWSGFEKNNPNSNLVGTTPSQSQDFQRNYREHGTVSSSTTSVTQDKNNEKFFNPSFSKPSVGNENSGLGNTASGIFSSNNAENSGQFGNIHNEWTAWDYPASSGVEKTGSDLSTSADFGFSDFGNKDSRLSARQFREHSGSHLPGGRFVTAQQSSGSNLPNRIAGAAANGGNYEHWRTKSSSWPKWGSSWPDGSGFGWYRANEGILKNGYGTQTPSPNTRFYYDRVSGKWTYPTNNGDAYDYNYNYIPTSKMGINANTGGSSYSKAISSNTWDPYYNYGETNQTKDWTNVNVLNGQSGETLKTTSSSVRQNNVENFDSPSTTNQNQIINEQHQTSAKISGEEMYNSIHRWPLEEGRGKEPVDDNSKQLHTAISSHGSKPTSRVNHVKSKKSKQRQLFVQKFPKTKRKPKSGMTKRKRKGKASYHGHHSIKIGKSKISKKTQARNNVKKFVIPYRNVLQLHRKRAQVEDWKVKSKVNLRGKKPSFSTKVRRPKERSHDKKRHKNTAISKNRPKRPRRFLSYSSYKSFVKKHHISDVLVGKWHHKIYHIRHCKTLSQFKADGLVQLGRQYMHHKRKYKYTILSCRHVEKENNNNYDSQEREDDRDTVSPSASQICREFWYITSGKIMLRELKRGDSVNTYTVTLCNTGSSSMDSSVTAPEGERNTADHSDDDADNSDASNRIGDDNGDKNLYVDVSSDDDSKDNSGIIKNTGDRTDDMDTDDKTDAEKTIGNDNDDDNNIDLDDDDDFSETTKGSGKENPVDNSNSNDDDDDFDKNIDNDSQKTDINRESKYDDSATETDDILTDSTSGGGILATQNSESDHDDKAIEDDDDLDLDKNEDIEEDTDKNTGNKHNRWRKSSVRKNKTKDRKIRRKTSKIRKRKSLINKNPHKRLKLHKTLTTNDDRKQKTALNRDAADDKSDLFERLRQVLVKNNDINDDEDGALAKLVATISQTKLSEKRDNKKAPIHLRKTKRKIRKGTSIKKKESPPFRKKAITNTQNIRTILQKLLTNSKNVQSHSQVTRKKLEPERKMDRKGIEKGIMEKVSAVKPASDVDTADILRALLPHFLPGSTAVMTAAPVPTVQPTVATTHARNPVPILSLLRKLGLKENLNGKTTSALERLLPEKKSRDGLSTDNLLETKRTSSIGQGVPPLKHGQLSLYRNVSELIPSNRGEQPLAQTENLRPENSLRANTPTAKPTQDFLSPPISSQPLATRTAPMFTAEARNAIAAPRLQGIKEGNTSDSTSGYSTYRSPKNNAYSLQTPLMNVLCFGDSLTSGYYNHGRGKHPYSIRLNQLLNPGGAHRYAIVTRGVIGEMAHGSMTKRLPKVLNEGTRFDWVLILGGTNDVAHVKNFGDDEEFTSQLISVWSPKIVKDIKQLHEIARQYGARTVLMTIPETAYELWPEFRSIRNMRLSVNAALRQYATQVRDTTVLCDLAIKLPRSTLSKELRKVYWNDHIHMNPIGYNKMADIIEQCIRPYLSK